MVQITLGPAQDFEDIDLLGKFQPVDFQGPGQQQKGKGDNGQHHEMTTPVNQLIKGGQVFIEAVLADQRKTGERPLYGLAHLFHVRRGGER